MKKYVIGGVLVIVLLVVFGPAAYFFYTSGFLDGDTMYKLTQLGELNDQVANKALYSPPPDNRLTSDQLRGFVEIQREVRIGAGPSYEKVRAVLASLPEATDFQFEFMFHHRKYKGLEPDLIWVKKEQVAALNRRHLSIGEYRWIRENILRALGRTPGATYIDDLGRKKSAADSLRVTVAPTAELRVPAENVTLVQGFADSLKSWVPMSLCGL